MGSRISSTIASAIWRTSSGSEAGTPSSHAASSSRVFSQAWGRLMPPMVTCRTASLTRVPPQSWQVPTRRYFSTRLMPFSSFTLASAFSTVRTAL